MLPQHEIERVLLARIDLHALARTQLVQRLARELAVAGEFAHGVIDIAARALISKALRLQHFDDFLHAVDEFRGAGLVIGFLHAQGRRVLVHVADEALSQLADAFPVLNSAADDLVVDVGDVAYVGDIEAGGAQPALHHVEYQHEARMAQMAVIVDSDAAHVHAHPARLDRDEILLAAGEGVVYLQHAQKTAGMRPTTPHLPSKHGTTAEKNSATASIVEVRV